MAANPLPRVRRELRQSASPSRAEVSKRYFKTGPGEYGAGDMFIGVTLPQIRTVAKRLPHLPRRDLKTLLRSPIHEERLLALIMLVHQFHSADPRTRAAIARLYLAHTKFINNWDLVDVSAAGIVGAWLDRPIPKKKRPSPPSMTLLTRLARSKSLWERRIAMIATYHFIRKGNPFPALTIARILLRDREDLIHKAVGWMLREVGRYAGEKTERTFLDTHASVMPRTMLRYAIERFPPAIRANYLLRQSKTRTTKRSPKR